MKKVTLAILIVLFAITGIVGFDVYHDRQNRIIVKGPVPVYSDWKSHPRDRKPEFILNSDTGVKIKRIRYGKSYMAVRIESQNGQSGWIFFGETSQ